MQKIFISIALLSCSYFGVTANPIESENENLNCESALFPEPPCCGKALNLRSQIKGGIKAREKELPFMVNIADCGGSLINARWVLSAAHCFQSQNPKFVTLGTINCDLYDGCDSYAKKFEVKKVICHEDYAAHKYHDLALLQLKKPVPFSDFIYPICLPFSKVIGSNIINKDASVAGWGKNETHSSSEFLLRTFVEIWDGKKCEEFGLLDEKLNSEYQICAGGVSNVDSCKGDSGGPLFMQLPPIQNLIEDPMYQIGIVSFGSISCGEKGHPGVYANISTYIEWIREKIATNP